MTSALQQRIVRSEIPNPLTNIPLVMLHGWGLNSGVFDQIAPLLAQHSDVILIDLPGFGDNANMPLTSLEAVIEQIHSALPDRCNLLGWSLGGVIAQKFVLTYPERIENLVCVASTPFFMAQAHEWFGIAPKVLQQFETQLATNYQKTVQRFLAIQAMGSVSAKQDMHVLKDAIARYPEPCEASLLQGLKLLQTVDIRKEIDLIQCPTLRIYGRLDALVPNQAVNAIEALQPKATSVVMEHVSHAPFISDKNNFVQIVRDFLQKS